MRFVPVLILALLTAGCSERLYIPSNFSTDRPKEVVGLVETPGLDLLMENMEVTPKHFIYDLEVYNKSDQAVTVNPHMIYYYGSYTPFTPLAPGEEVHVSFGEANADARGVHALKEEHVNSDIRATIKSRQAVAMILVVAATALVVNDAIQDSKDYNQEFWSSADARRSDARDVATFAGLITLDMVRTGMQIEQAREFEDLEYLPEEYLHKTILLPGERIRGKVFLPRRDIEHLRMVVPVESTDYIFDFRKASGKEMRLIRHVGG